MRNLGHPSPHFNDAKMARFLLLGAFIIALGGGGWGIIVSFYSVQDCRCDCACVKLWVACGWLCGWLCWLFVIQDGRYLPYALHECIWTTPHNNDHGYIREITAIGMTGKEIIVKAMWSGFSFRRYLEFFWQIIPHLGLRTRLLSIGFTA